MPVALITHVIHFAWPDASARGCTVSPSSTTGRNGRPFTAGGGTGWTFATISTVIDLSRSFSADGSAIVTLNSGKPLTSSSRGRTGRLRALSSCDWYSVTAVTAPTTYAPSGNNSSNSIGNRLP